MRTSATAFLITLLFVGLAHPSAKAGNQLSGPDCEAAMRNGLKGAFNPDGTLNMSFRCQDYSDGSWWTLGQYVRARGR